MFESINMKGLFGLLLFLFVFIFLFNCIYFISPGHVGVVVNLIGDERGVESRELTVGGYFIFPWKQVYRFPIFEQNYTWEGEDHAFNFQTSEGMACSADVGITYHLQPAQVHMIVQKYRRGMDEITHVFIRNYIRDAFSKAAARMKIEDLYGIGKSLFFSEVEKEVREHLAPLGIDVTRIYLIGRFHFPPNVIAALNSKMEAIQRAQQRENELREAEAEAKKQIAKATGQAQCALLKAESEAKANQILAASVTPELILWQAVQCWDGKLPQVTGSSMPFVKLK